MSTDKPEFQPSSSKGVANNAATNKPETTRFEQENIHSASAYLPAPQLQTTSQNFVPTGVPQSSFNSFQQTGSATNTGNGMQENESNGGSDN